MVSFQILGLFRQEAFQEPEGQLLCHRACSEAAQEHTLPYNCKVYAVTFLQNFAEANAILLPGRIPGYKRDDMQLLPSSMTKKVLISTHIHIPVSYNSRHTKGGLGAVQAVV